MLEIRLLGRFEIRADGGLIELPSRAAQTLCAYLLLNRNKIQRRELIAGCLWPDMEEGKARSKLRYAFWQLRNAIGGEYFHADRVSIGFVSHQDYWLDIAFLEDTQAQNLSTQELQLSVAHYAGELLPGFYEDWISLERERLRALFEHRMELLLIRLIEEGSWREVIEKAEGWIAMGGSPEPAFQSLMIAHTQLGDVSKAAFVYQRCVQRLQEQIGVDPSAETRQIYLMITRGEKPRLPLASRHTRPSEGELPAFLGKEAVLDEERKTIFVAHESELLQLFGVLEQAISGQGSVFCIRGDAGSGKTALQREFCRQALMRYPELIALHGRGEANTGWGDPHLPFRDVLSLLMGNIENKWAEGILLREGAQRLWHKLPRAIEVLLEMGSDLIDSFISGDSILAWAGRRAPEGAVWFEKLEQRVELRRGRPVPLNIQHSDLQMDLFEQFAHVLFELARETPLLVFLDDLQWADLGSISLLFHLGRRIEGHRILILGAYRVDEITREWDGKGHPLLQVLAEFKRKFGDFEIDLDRSDAEMDRQFVDAFLDTEANRLDDKFRQALFQHTGGHPLFTVELLRQMQAQGDLKKDQEGRWVEGPTLGWETLPARVEAVIARRVNRLPDNFREILRFASIEGEEFHAQVIAELLGIDDRIIVQQLSQDLDKVYNLVEAIGTQYIGSQRLSRYRFRHQLFHQYVYSTLDPVQRSHLHEDIGSALERLYGDYSQLISVRLARHFEEAGLVDQAVDYLLSAAEIAKRQSANEEAITHLRRGLYLLGSPVHDRDRIRKELDLQIAIGAPLVALKGYTAPEAEQAFERARVLCEQINDVERLVTALWGLWSFYLVRANYQTARELAEQIFNQAQSNESPDLYLVAHWTLGITLVHLGDFTIAQRHLDRAIEIYDSEKHQHLTYLFGQNPATTCLIYRAYNLWFLGHTDQALESTRIAFRLAEEIDHLFSLAFVHGMASGFFALRLEINSASHHADKALSLARKGGFPFLIALGVIMRGWARAMMGKTSMTSGQMRRGIDAMRTIGAQLGHPIFLTFLAEAHNAADEIEEALNVVHEAITIAHNHHERVNESDLQRVKGELLEKMGFPDTEIIECFHQAVEIARQQSAMSFELRSVTSLAKFLAKRKECGKSREDLARICEWFTEGLDSVDLREARNLLDQDQ